MLATANFTPTATALLVAAGAAAAVFAPTAVRWAAPPTDGPTTAHP